MAEHMSGDPDANDRFVRLDDGDMHVAENGKPGAASVVVNGLAHWAAMALARAGVIR